MNVEVLVVHGLLHERDKDWILTIKDLCLVLIISGKEFTPEVFFLHNQRYIFLKALPQLRVFLEQSLTVSL
jgi:hypothetical protein